MIEIDTASESFERNINVQFAQPNGSMRQGDFKARFKRIPQARVEEMMDDQWRNSDVLDEVLVCVSGIGRRNPQGGVEELPAEEQLDWVRRTVECVNAATSSFFEAMQQGSGGSKTSRKRP